MNTKILLILCLSLSTYHAQAGCSQSTAIKQGSSVFSKDVVQAMQNYKMKESNNNISSQPAILLATHLMSPDVSATQLALLNSLFATDSTGTILQFTPTAKAILTSPNLNIKPQLIDSYINSVSKPDLRKSLEAAYDAGQKYKKDHSQLSAALSKPLDMIKNIYLTNKTDDQILNNVIFKGLLKIAQATPGDIKAILAECNHKAVAGRKNRALEMLTAILTDIDIVTTAEFKKFSIHNENILLNALQDIIINQDPIPDEYPIKEHKTAKMLLGAQYDPTLLKPETKIFLAKCNNDHHGAIFVKQFRKALDDYAIAINDEKNTDTHILKIVETAKLLSDFDDLSDDAKITEQLTHTIMFALGAMDPTDATFLTYDQAGVKFQQRLQEIGSLDAQAWNQLTDMGKTDDIYNVFLSFIQNDAIEYIPLSEMVDKLLSKDNTEKIFKSYSYINTENLINAKNTIVKAFALWIRSQAMKSIQDKCDDLLSQRKATVNLREVFERAVESSTPDTTILKVMTTDMQAKTGNEVSIEEIQNIISNWLHAEETQNLLMATLNNALTGNLVGVGFNLAGLALSVVWGRNSVFSSIR